MTPLNVENRESLGLMRQSQIRSVFRAFGTGGLSPRHAESRSPCPRCSHFAVSETRVIGRDKVIVIGKPGEQRLEHPR